MTLDISHDYLIFDDLVQVRYEPRVNEGTFGIIETFNNCKFNAEEKGFVGANESDLRRVYAGLTIWVNETSGLVPKRGDRVGVVGINDSRRWIVESVEYDTFAQAYRLRMYSI